MRGTVQARGGLLSEGCRWNRDAGLAPGPRAPTALLEWGSPLSYFHGILCARQAGGGDANAADEPGADDGGLLASGCGNGHLLTPILVKS
jgi:hypothetical protein